jgi:hypothetical protein
MANANNRRRSKFKKWVRQVTFSLLGLVGAVYLRPYVDFSIR